ncbi:hypothetical protein QZH41_001308 [Actinostola sp. cb2023]|nr:hypothetical protein QZH41_001308 [Actinostola sp. cb2023]
MKVTLPLFKRRALTYIQWTPTTNDSALDLHYQSLNIPPPLKINKTILNALDQTFRRIDGNIITKLQKNEIDTSFLDSDLENSEDESAQEESTSDTSDIDEFWEDIPESLLNQDIESAPPLPEPKPKKRSSGPGRRVRQTGEATVRAPKMCSNDVRRRLKKMAQNDENSAIKVEEGQDSEHNLNLLNIVVNELYHEYGGEANCPWTVLHMKAVKFGFRPVFLISVDLVLHLSTPETTYVAQGATYYEMGTPAVGVSP